MSRTADPPSPPGRELAPVGATFIAPPVPAGTRGGPVEWLLTIALAAALCAVTFVADGGLRLGSTTSFEIGAILVSGVLIAVALVLAPARGRLHGALPVVLFAVLAGVAAWSITWAVNPSDAWVDADRHLAYLAVFTAAVALAHLAVHRWTAVVGAITLFGVAISAYALLTKVLPGVFSADEVYSRLRAPYGYWNSVGITAATAIPGLLWFGARRTGHGALNALAAPGVAICVATILVAYSRGALLAVAVGGALWFALVPLRLRGVATLVLGAAGGGAIAVWTFSERALSSDGVALADRESSGYELGVCIAAVLLVLLALSLGMRLAAARNAPRRTVRRQAGGAVLVALALVPVTLAAAAAFSDRGLGGTVSHGWRTLTDPNANPPSNAPGRLTAAGSVRARYWNEALKAFRDNPWRGVGAGGYATVRPRYRQDQIDVRHAHGYVVQLAADLGIVGLAVSLALLAAWLACALAATGYARAPGRRAIRRRPYSAERVALLTLLAMVVTFGVHSLVDFTWFVPGNAVPALLAAGFLAGRGPLWAPEPAAHSFARRVRSGVRDPLRVAGAIACVALALVAAWVVWQPQRSANAGQDALALLDRGNVPAARAEAQVAIDRNPLSVQPLFELSVVEQRAGSNPAARRALERAIRLQPSNAQTWLRLAEFELHVLRRPSVALSAVRPALFLDPRSSEAIDTWVQARREAAAAAARRKG